MSGKQKRSLQSRLFSITSALYTLYSLRAFSLFFYIISIKTEILVLLKLNICIIQAFIWTNLYIAKLFNLSSIRICLQFLSYLLLKVCNHRVNIPYFIQKLMRNFFCFVQEPYRFEIFQIRQHPPADGRHTIHYCARSDT